MVKRKTINVSALTDMVNSILKDSGANQAVMREGAINVLEAVLHETGNYRGFRYLLSGECDGLPGVNYLNGLPHPNYEKRFANTDNTRVSYA